jgi:hypothetical protein
MPALSLSAAPDGMLSAQNDTLCGPPVTLWKVTTSPDLIVRLSGENL